ncbi:MAG: AMP-binding protein [Candidatus Dadabacteria bacterium]|nr:AMP-binding protein [Candidatus Dadabacteria bacterium]NIQ14410.1 AMP-binding protein [Candidatus Dadabacteria bacterium]
MNENNFYNLLDTRVKKYKSKLIYQKRDGWSWKQITWQDLEAEVKSISSFLLDLKFNIGDQVVFNSTNTLESLLFEMAVFLVGGISIPVNNDEEILKILDNTKDNYYLFSDNKESIDNILLNNLYSGRIIKSFVVTEENTDIAEKYLNYKNVVHFGFIKRKKLNDELQKLSQSISGETTATIFYQFNGFSTSKINRFSQEKIINLLKIIQKKLKFITEENQTYAYLPVQNSFSKFINLLNIQIGNRGAIASNLKDFYDDILEVMPNIIYLTKPQLEFIMDEFSINSLGSIKENFGGRLKYILTNTSPNNDVKIALKKAGISIIELNQLSIVE